MDVSGNIQQTILRLVDVCRRGEPVLFAGLGLSIESGYPSWPSALQELAGQLPDSASVNEAIRSQNLDVLADTIANNLSQQVIRQTLKRLYWTEHQSWSREWSPLRLLPFGNIVTPGWDASVERAFGSMKTLEVLSPSSTRGLDALFGQGSCLIRLHGNLHSDNDEIILSQEQFRGVIARNPQFGRYVASLISGHSHIFVGSSPRTIIQYLRLAPTPSSSSKGWHFALLADDASLRLYSDLLKNCDVSVISYNPANNGRRALLEQIAAKFGRPQQGWNVSKSGGITSKVEWIRLKNVGVFDELEYPFESHWNVVLGNNGSGKSTLLKALAFGLASSEPSVALWGKKLLARGKKHGSIEVCIGGVEYRTDIGTQTQATNVRVASPVEIGKALALGYPALRGGPSENATGPMHRAENTWSSDDITPLLSGALDSRMGVLKQWVINSAVRERLGAAAESDAPPDAIAKFHVRVFELLSEIVPDSAVEFHSIDESDWSIKVIHRDRVVDLDDLSQGLSSMLGWVAHAYHRITQVLGTGDRPQTPAIIIIDELDAHMHPEWQQALPLALSKFFPNDQFVIATHSPFLAIGRRVGEVKRIYQSPSSRRFTIYPVVTDTSAWGAGGALTSHLFGLQSLLPKALEKAAIQKRILSAKPNLNKLDLESIVAADLVLKGVDWAHGLGSEDLTTDVVSDADRFAVPPLPGPLDAPATEPKLTVTDREALEIVRAARASPKEPKA